MDKAQNNNFDFLRQFAAFLVIFGHSESIVGTTHTGFWGVSISTLGIQIFFAVSGYLVTDSWLRQPKLGAFLRKRIRRIFPALIVCICISVFLLGPLLTRLTINEYLTNSNTYNYLFNIILYPIYNLPGVFENNTYPNAVNGSLWSLPIEFTCYIGVALFALAAMLCRKSLSSPTSTILLLILAATMTLLSQTALKDRPPIVYWGSAVREAFEIAPYFVMGSCLRIAFSSFLIRVEVLVIVVFAMVAVMSNQPQYFWTISWIVTPFLALSFGISRLSLLPRFGRWGDPSYGMYLYAFPVQQTLQHITDNGMSFSGMVMATTLICLVLGYISWHFLEKRFLSRSRAK